MNTRTIQSAGTVASWANVGIKFDDDLAQAVEIFEALTYFEVGHLLNKPIDITEVTRENAEDVILGYAQHLAVAAPKESEHASRLSNLELAKSKYLEAAASRVVSLARSRVPDAIKQLTPRFEKHAAAYVAAVAKLPADLTSDTLVREGTNALAAYGDARREAQSLNRIDHWLSSTAHLSIGKPDVALHLLRPASVGELEKLDFAVAGIEKVVALNAKKFDKAVTAIDPVFYTAAKNGIEFGINSLAEASALRKALTARPASRLVAV